MKYPFQAKKYCIQGNQNRGIVYFAKFIENYLNSPNFWANMFKGKRFVIGVFDTKCILLHIGLFY
jgi:hypothetical protein